MKIIKFATPKGECYVPLKTIAEHRAKHYAEGNEKRFEEEVNYVLTDSYEGIDWMSNNMDLEDFEKDIVVLNDKCLVTDEDGWENSSFKIEELIPQIVPTSCPACEGKLSIVTNNESGATGLYCLNNSCSGKAVKRLEKGINQLKIKGIGPATCEKLHIAGICDIEDLFDKTKFNRMKLIESNEFKEGQTLEKIVNAIDFIDSLELKRIINSLNITDVGESVSHQIALYLSDMPHDFDNLNKAAIKVMTDENSEERKRLSKFINIIKDNNIEIVIPKAQTSDTIYYEMTGNPGSHIGKKSDFAMMVVTHGYEHHKLNKDCDILVTDNLESNTGKMKKAKKLGKEIKTYDQILQDLNL